MTAYDGGNNLGSVSRVAALGDMLLVFFYDSMHRQDQQSRQKGLIANELWCHELDNARVFSIVLGLTLVSVVGLPFLGVVIETAKPTTYFAGVDRFLAFEGILYAVSGITSAERVWVLTPKNRARSFWTIVLTG